LNRLRRRVAAVPGMRSACLAAACLAAAASTGCSRGTPEPEPAGTPTVTPTPDPRTVIWALDAAPTTLDAARIATEPGAAQVAAQVYDGLVRYRPGTTNLAPGIAEDWDAEVDGRSFTFTLREGLTFHDGTALDARAVVWNFNRWRDPDHPAHRTDFLAWQALLEAGNTEEGRPTGLVDRVEAIDARTVRITLNAPFSPFLHVLALVPLGLASPTAVQHQGDAYGSDAAHPPVGSGPFRVVDWSPAGRLRLAPFEDYWAGPPAAPGLEFTVIADPAARAAAVAGDLADGAELPPTFDIETERSPRIRYMPRPARTTAWLMLNHSRAPFGDARVRRAISLTIDRVSLSADRFGEYALPAGQILPPGFLGHAAEIEPLVHDRVEARRLLEEAGVTDLPLVVWVANEPRPHLPDPAGTAASVAAMLQDIGIAATVRTESLRQFLADRDRGRFSAWIIGWEAQSADPDNFWFFHFWTSRMPSEGHYDNQELANRLLEAQRTLGAEERERMYTQSAMDVDRDTARIFLAHTRPILVLSTRLDGLVPSPMGFDSLEDVTVRARPAGLPSEPTAVTPKATAPTETAGPPGDGTPPSPEATIEG
jgi:peptide/nickel transport system substrate-binding protein